MYNPLLNLNLTMFIYKVTNPPTGSDIHSVDIHLLKGEQQDFQENTARWLVDTYKFLSLLVEEVPDPIRRVEPTIEEQLKEVKEDIKEIKEDKKEIKDIKESKEEEIGGTKVYRKFKKSR